VANISNNASSLAFPDSWVSMNGSSDLNTSKFCQLLCGRSGQVHTEVREAVSCFALAYYFIPLKAYFTTIYT
jgi:hypothetical protein